MPETIKITLDPDGQSIGFSNNSMVLKLSAKANNGLSFSDGKLVATKAPDGSGGSGGAGVGSKKTTASKQNAYVTRNGVGGYKLVNSSTGQAMEYWSGQSKTSGMPDNEEALDYFKRKYQNLSISYLSYMSGFATGGYTGTWGKDGKLAVLHEKELVLNKEDTANILQAVSAIRNITGSNSQLSNAILKSGNVQAHMLSQVSSGIMSGFDNINTNNSTSNSMVINADFSGVNSADEIYQALLELQNYGLQQNYSVAPHINMSY